MQKKTLSTKTRLKKAQAKELRKIDVNVLLIKIAKNEGLRVDAGVLNRGMN